MKVLVLFSGNYFDGIKIDGSKIGRKSSYSAIKLAPDKVRLPVVIDKEPGINLGNASDGF